MSRYDEQKIKNQHALDNPRVGDYWNEMFCPYFIVVEVLKDDKFRVLSCLGGSNNFNRKDELNARIDNKDGTWSFDYNKDMIVDRAWIAKAVRYETIDGFVANVRNSDETQTIANEWRVEHANILRKAWEEKRAEWEAFTGWTDLKEPV